ncbi:MAG: spermidine synthase [Candidatus Eremiobacteraeota bacterium]|nr:spermidine synthase [Candidatus Eremiobacteraeota bacterium]
MTIKQNARGRLILLSFLMLFVELTLIRWVGSNVIYLSYFSNFVLLGSFLGIGIGFLRAKSAFDMFAWAPVMLAFLVSFILLFPVTVDCAGSQIIYFGCTPSGLPIWVTLPIIFLAVAFVMASIAQGVARSFVEFEPLEAYRLDIVGSLGGIVGFSLLSFSGAPPLGWGVVVCALFLIPLARYRPSVRLVEIVALAGMLIMLGKESFAPGDSWSPYYKISLQSVRAGITALYVNGIPHQAIESIADRRKTEPVYFLPYKRLNANALRSVLVVGAGNGSDVAIALAAGAKHVDAVEIDPRIYQIGKRMNPNHPYQQSRVSVHINDGRAFLEQTHKRYDLILFALPDSLALVSGQSSLRLESYLFTLEAMTAARTHLSANGVFGMYNYYREQWLLDRLARTLEVTYGHRPCVDAVGSGGKSFSLLIVGRNVSDVRCATTWQAATRFVPAPTHDDRPFLYLKRPSIPQLYLLSIATIMLASLLLIRGATGPLGQMKSYADLFFMGAAFMLLETKNVVQFALLFGTTWFVNALVFFGILLSVFFAVELSRRFRLRRPELLYVALCASLAIAWLVPPESLLSLSISLRFVTALALAFTPIFLANLIFAERFRNVGASTIAFGANLLGAMVGGVLEYSSLIVGYRALLPLVGLLYALAFIFGWKHREATAPALLPRKISPLIESLTPSAL